MGRHDHESPLGTKAQRRSSAAIPLAAVSSGVLLGIAIGVFSLHALADDRTGRSAARRHPPGTWTTLPPRDQAPRDQAPRDQAPRNQTERTRSARTERPAQEPPTAGSIDFLTSRGRQCRRRRRRIVCDGPLRVARPHGPEAELAERLGLAMGTRRLPHDLLWEPARAEWLAAIRPGPPTPARLQWPVEGRRLWRGFGYVRRRRSVRHRPHLGIDIGAPDGTPIRSVADGLVTYSDNGVSGYGNLLMILHRDGSLAVYAHNRANFVFAGQQVEAGQVVAEVGHTGLARGPHLHFELRQGGRPRNPMRRLREPNRRERASDLTCRCKHAPVDHGGSRRHA